MFRLGFIAVIALLSGCASITTGQHQIVSINTTQCPAASCELSNKDGVYYVDSTPGTVNVNRACGQLTIRCSKEGYDEYVMSVSSSIKAMAFGNILFGGFIGAGIDAATGAACEYPSLIPVPMKCGDQASQQAILDRPIPEEVQELAEKEECVDLEYVGDGPNQTEVYQGICKEDNVLITCDDESCGISKIEIGESS